MRVSLNLLGLLALALLGAGPARAADRPNIIFILADDLDAASIRHLPEVRALAAAGTSFAAAYAGTPLCAPSRVAMLTGDYPQNTGIRRNRPPAGGLETVLARGDLERRMVPVWLRAAGYRTGFVGKYLNEHRMAG